MLSVQIARLKNNLSMYLKRVQHGEEVIVLDRKKPVARIIPMPPDLDEELRELAAEGLIRLPIKPLPKNFWKTPGLKISAKKILKALEEEREDRV